MGKLESKVADIAALDKRIKVIKRGERSNRSGSLSATRPDGEQQAEQPRTAVVKNNVAIVVTSWVRERHQRKGVDARHAFESLFREAA